MQWKEVESEIRLETLSDAFRHLDCLSALNAIIGLGQGIRVYMLQSCAQAVLAHVRAEKYEVGGLLLGHVYQADVTQIVSAEALTVVTQSVPSHKHRNSSVSLEMNTEVWSRANDHLSSGNIVVGWYHSHPNLGAFFSGTDRRTQRAFFNHHYSLGWVIDPIRDQQRVFCGGESEEYLHRIVEIDHGLEMATVS